MARLPIHRGEHQRYELEVLDMSAAELGRQLDVPINCVAAILNGQRSVAGQMGLRFARFFRQRLRDLA